MPNYLFSNRAGVAADGWTEITFVDNGIPFQSNYIIVECSVNPLLVQFSYDGINYTVSIVVNPLMPKFPYPFAAKKVRYMNMTAGLPSTFQITGLGA
jgi:hypothetical protein